MKDGNQIIELARGLAGAAIGGAVGYYAFAWILGYGLYAMILPGAALGYGFSLCTQQRSMLNGIICAVLAVGLGLFAEWKHFRFKDEKTVLDFLTQLHHRTPVTLIMIAVGALLAYWSANGRTNSGPSESQPSRD